METHASSRPTTAEQTAEQAGVQPLDLAGGSVSQARDAIRERLGPIVSGNLSSRSVVIVGLGSGGSHTAEALVRSGVEKLTLIDPDVVEPANISRAVYTMRDVGTPKVEAMHRRLKEINAQVRCDLIAAPLQQVPVGQIDQIIGAADLVVAATDDPVAQRAVNHFSYHRKIPAVFAGVYARGHGGEVVFTVPGITRCYRCATAPRHNGEAERRLLDYGTGRLTAEPALGADILHIVTASVKIALALLELAEDGEEIPLRDFMVGALSRGFNYLIMSTVPDYGFFPRIFAKVPGQYAYQSAWLVTVGDPACRVCGHEPADPTTLNYGGAPDTAKLTKIPSG
jgi:molybdopterin/thiamine biosynthesis adenylyltransferase